MRSIVTALCALAVMAATGQRALPGDVLLLAPGGWQPARHCMALAAWPAKFWPFGFVGGCRQTSVRDQRRPGNMSSLEERTGRVVLLNGPPSYGKTTLAQALVRTSNEPWFH